MGSCTLLQHFTLRASTAGRLAPSAMWEEPWFPSVPGRSSGIYTYLVQGLMNLLGFSGLLLSYFYAGVNESHLKTPLGTQVWCNQRTKAKAPAVQSKHIPSVKAMSTPTSTLNAP